MDCVNLWEPLRSIEETEKKDIALIKLNTPLGPHKENFCALWKKAKLTVVVDGAINEFYKCAELRRDHEPDIISGDFDSADPQILEFYRQKGTEIIPTPDQNETDFTKALRIVCDKLKNNKSHVSAICAHVSFDGRFDHILANINTLFLAKRLTTLPVYLISGDSLAFLIDKGKCMISVASPHRGSWCGLIPMNGPCQSVTTSGLRYNLDHEGMAFGGMVSTSNSFDSDLISIDTDNSIVFTMGTKSL